MYQIHWINGIFTFRVHLHFCNIRMPFTLKIVFVEKECSVHRVHPVMRMILSAGKCITQCDEDKT